MLSQDCDLVGVSTRIEQELTALRQQLDPVAYTAVEELLRLLLTFYGAGLERILRHLEQQGETGGAVLRALLSDPVVSALLIAHGLHPLSVEERVNQALERVRPYLRSHLGDVALLGIDEHGVAHLRLSGMCHGCPASQLTVQGLIEQAIRELAPEVMRIEVEGTNEEHSLGPTRARLQTKEKPVRWIPLDGQPLPAGTVQSRQVAGQEVVLCQLNGQLYAYYNRCPACAASLGSADLHDDVLRCRSCGQRYAVRQAGRGLDSAVSLIPLPVLWKEGTWQIAISQANQM